MRSWIFALACLALAGCCGEGVEHSRGFVVDPADPGRADLLDECLELDTRCEALCLQLTGPPPSDTTRDILDCYLDSRSDGQYDATVRWVDLEDCF